MAKKVELIATAAFGLEAIVGHEVKDLGFEDVQVENGKVTFKGDISAIPRANLWLRTADRVLLKMGEFKATSFEELFEKTKRLPWYDWIPKNGKFPVSKAKSVKSKLYSLSDCQAITKKAVVESMKAKYNIDWFEETGPEFPIMVSLHKDVATLTIDTSGAGLHKRGYRKGTTEAPLKETLAAGLIHISRWSPERILYDPFCGSGTIPIEAAMIGKNIAPGLHRGFISQDWPVIPDKVWKKERSNALKSIRQDNQIEILASDIDKRAIQYAMDNAFNAGVDMNIKFQKLPFERFSSKNKYCYVITNPPYGERIGESREVKNLYRLMGEKLLKHDTWSLYILTSHPEFEKLFGKRATKNRKLYNGRIKTYLYQYHGPKPPRRN